METRAKGDDSHPKWLPWSRAGRRGFALFFFQRFVPARLCRALTKMFYSLFISMGIFKKKKSTNGKVNDEEKTLSDLGLCEAKRWHGEEKATSSSLFYEFFFNHWQTCNCFNLDNESASSSSSSSSLKFHSDISISSFKVITVVFRSILQLRGKSKIKKLLCKLERRILQFWGFGLLWCFSQRPQMESN